MSEQFGTNNNPKNFDELRTKIRDWLTIFFYISILLGLFFGFILKPQSDKLNNDFRIRTLETRIETVENLLNEKIVNLEKKTDLMLRILKRGS